MASVENIVLFNGTGSANLTGPTIAIEALKTDFVMSFALTAFTGTNITMTVQRSPDLVFWTAWQGSGALTAASNVIFQPNTFGLGYVRLFINYNGPGSYTAKVTLSYDTRTMT